MKSTAQSPLACGNRHATLAGQRRA